MQRRLFILGLLPAVASLPALAAERSFPTHAKRGKLAAAPFPQVSIDGKLRRMTPGSRIWNEHNLTIVPAELGTNQYLANYTETEQGEIDRIWILTPAEQGRPVGEQKSNLFR